MSAMQRRKGAQHEREVVRILQLAGHTAAARNLGQVRDGGADIPIKDWLIECKRRARIAIYEWFDQCVRAASGYAGTVKPLLVMRGDDRENLVVMRLTDFLELVRDHDATSVRRADRPDTTQQADI